MNYNEQHSAEWLRGGMEALESIACAFETPSLRLLAVECRNRKQVLAEQLAAAEKPEAQDPVLQHWKSFSQSVLMALTPESQRETTPEVNQLQIGKIIEAIEWDEGGGYQETGVVNAIDKAYELGKYATHNQAIAAELEALAAHINEHVGPDDARDDIKRICLNRARVLRGGVEEQPSAAQVIAACKAALEKVEVVAEDERLCHCSECCCGDCDSKRLREAKELAEDLIAAWEAAQG